MSEAKDVDRGPVILTGLGIRAFHLLQWNYAIKLEAKGLKHSSGRSVRQYAAINLGLRPRTPAQQVIAEIDRKLAEIKAAQDGGQQ